MRRSTLRPRPPVDRSAEPGYREWHAPIFGTCEVCGMGHQPLERHHVMHEQHVRREAGWAYDMRNSIEIGRYCACHRQHTSATRRLPASKIPQPALAFMVELLGEDRTADYIVRYYRIG